MSPASKSKAKEKKAGKEPQKVLLKPSGPANASSGIPASAYNPLSGTFHTLETMLSSSDQPLHTNGRFRNIDLTEDHLGVSLGAGVDCDSISNNGSWSGESEEHKDKPLTTLVRPETVPGADTDKREKIRQKNEKKHQRQKERRAQELHERCCGYIMSRKLEARVQQLVSMGFSNERATAALMFNEGKIEESIAWLIEAGQDVEQRGQDVSGGNLKIDIAEELGRIADMEIHFKCTKQEVERAVVVSEGDLEKAAESLRSIKKDPPATPLKLEEIGESSTATNGKLSVSTSQNAGRPLSNPSPASMSRVRREDKESNYTKGAAPFLGPSESRDKSAQSLKRIQPKMDWVKSQQTALPADKRWPNGVPNPSVSNSLSSPLQVSPLSAKTESRLGAPSGEYKSIQPTVREPVVMMQRPQSVNTKQVPATSISSSPPGTAAGWYPTSSVEIMKSNGLVSHIPSRITSNPNIPSSNQMFQHLQQYQQQQQRFVPGSSPRDSPGISRGNGLWSRVGASPTLSAATSLGLFSGFGTAGSSGASSPVDWSTAGSMMQLDYTNIDWSLDRGFSLPRTNGLWLGSGSLKNGTQLCDSNVSALGAKMAMRSIPNGNVVPVPGLLDGGVPTGETSASGSREWTSPFEGKDLFSLPRQFVSSPSL